MLDFALLAVFPTLMAFAAASDLVTMTIPNKLSLALIIAFGAFAFASGLPAQTVLMHVVAGALMLVLCFGMFAVGWIGGGDAKLAAATALWLGFDTLLQYLFVAAIGGGLLTLAILYLRGATLPAFALQWPWLVRLCERKTGIPYGIALAAAALFVYPQSPIWTAALTQ
jgi:prepilin peptidase CpaA